MNWSTEHNTVAKERKHYKVAILVRNYNEYSGGESAPNNGSDVLPTSW